MNLDFENLSYDQAQELKDALKVLVESAGWEIVRQLIEQRVENRLKELHNFTIETQEHVARYNKLQGGIQELSFVPTFVEQVFGDLTEEVRRLRDEELENIFEPKKGSDDA